jgi:hypothetical protein
VIDPTDIGGQVELAFPAQFPDAKVNQISYATTPILQFSNDGEDNLVSHGSGFFWRSKGEVFLVSARHVFTGLHPFSDELMSSSGYIPERFKVFPFVQFTPTIQTRIEHPFATNILAKNLFEDPQFKELRTDIAVVKLELDMPEKVLCLNDTNVFENLLSHVGFECTVVGYPLPNLVGLMTPVYRKGSIASEPRLAIDGKPMFLLDATTAPGFSGSPVFQIHIGPAPVVNEDGSLSVLTSSILTTKFVGVYAGRLQNRHFGGEVPFVFYGNRIPIILGGAS